MLINFISFSTFLFSCASPADPAVGGEVAKSNGEAEAPPQKEGGPKVTIVPSEEARSEVSPEEDDASDRPMLRPALYKKTAFDDSTQQKIGLCLFKLTQLSL